MATAGLILAAAAVQANYAMPSTGWTAAVYYSPVNGCQHGDAHLVIIDDPAACNQQPLGYEGSGGHKYRCDAANNYHIDSFDGDDTCSAVTPTSTVIPTDGSCLEVDVGLEEELFCYGQNFPENLNPFGGGMGEFPIHLTVHNVETCSDEPVAHLFSKNDQCVGSGPLSERWVVHPDGISFTMYGYGDPIVENREPPMTAPNCSGEHSWEQVVREGDCISLDNSWYKIQRVSPFCPPFSQVAAVDFGGAPMQPLHSAPAAAPWSWIPQDNVVLRPFKGEKETLNCGSYYGVECRRVDNGTRITVDCKSEVCDVYAFIYHEPPRSTQSNGRLPLTLPSAGWQPGSCAPDFCITAPPGTLPPIPAITSSPAKRVVNPGPSGNPNDELPDTRGARALDTEEAELECCKMTAFRKQADQGQQLSFTIDEVLGTMDAYYLVLAVAPGARCNANERSASREACESAGSDANVQCRWVEEAAESRARTAGVLSGIPTSSPTASPRAPGRCVDNWCPRQRVPVPPQQGPACTAPLTEPVCTRTAPAARKATVLRHHSVRLARVASRRA